MNLSRLVFFASGAILLSGLAFAAGLYSGASKNQVFIFARDLREAINDTYARISQGPHAPFLEPARHEGQGVTINRTSDGSLVLMSGFFDGGNEIRLVRRDGTVVANWPVSFTEIFPDTSHLSTPPADDFRVDLHGALIEPDGHVLFNFEYSGLVRLDRCGNVDWALQHPTHHSVEQAESGGYWVPGRIEGRSRQELDYEPYTDMEVAEQLLDDVILRISDSGEILTSKSVMELLLENGLVAEMTATGEVFKRSADWFGGEFVHLNKIGELKSGQAAAFPMFEAGDLVISLRDFNLVAVVDPDDWTVKWNRIGPWLRQHDPDFNDDGTITVFNNNTFHSLLEKGIPRAEMPALSEIDRVDFSDGAVERIYGNRESEEFLTIFRGKHDVTPDGGLLIVESESGRVFEVSANGKIVWEYINRYDDSRVAKVTDARLYADDYFNVSDWSCRKK